MPMRQGTNGPYQFDLDGAAALGSDFSLSLPTPPPPFDASKREYWAHATGQGVVFAGQDIGLIEALGGVSASDCEDFVNYLAGANGGPPNYPFDRYSIHTSSVVNQPDQLGTNPNIPGWADASGFRVQFTGTTVVSGRPRSYQGVIFRRWAPDYKSGEEYWLLNAPEGGFWTPDTVDFLGLAQTTKAPSALIETFPNELPDPDSAGVLSTYFLWYVDFEWDDLAADPNDWPGQICGS